MCIRKAANTNVEENLVCERCGQSVFKSVTPQADIAEDGEAATTREHSAIGDPCRRKSSEIDSPYNQP